MSTVADRMHWVSSSTRLADQTYDQMGFRSERGTGSGRDSIFVGVYLKPPLQFSSYALASTPGRIFAFTSDLAKIRPGIDCMLEKHAALVN